MASDCIGVEVGIDNDDGTSLPLEAMHVFAVTNEQSLAVHVGPGNAPFRVFSQVSNEFSYESFSSGAGGPSSSLNLSAGAAYHLSFCTIAGTSRSPS